MSALLERGWHSLQRRWGATPLAWPALLFVIALCGVPLTRLLLESLNAPDFSPSHYIQFFSQPANVRVLVGTLLLSLKVTLICLALGYPLAYLLTRLSGRVVAIALACVAIPHLTSFLVRTYGWIVLLNEHGVINDALLASGLIDQPLRLLYNEVGVLIGMVHVMLPFMILPLYAAMRGIDTRLMQAALSLGAGPLRSFLRVYLPLSLPGIASGCILVFVLCLGFYVTPAALGGPRDVTLAGLIEVQMTKILDFGFAAAASMILLVLTMVLLALLSRSKRQASAPANDADRGPPAHTALRSRLAMLLDRGRARLYATMWQRRLGRSGRSAIGAQTILRAHAVLVLLFLIAPSLIVVPMSFSSTDFLTFPPQGWSLRWYQSYFADPQWRSATALSVAVAVATALLATGLGTMAAYGLARGNSRGRELMKAIILAPLIIPAIVLGVGLYRLFVPLHLIGTQLGLVLAHSAAALSYVTVIVIAALAGVDPTLERAAASLGAGPIVRFRRVVAPLIRPAMIAGGLFAFMHSFDEIVATMFVAGFRLRTLPLKMWEDIRHTVDPTIAAVSSLLLLLPLLSLLLLTLLNRRLRNDRVRTNLLEGSL